MPPARCAANAKCANKRQPRDYFKREIFVDTMVFSEEGLRHLVAEVGVSQIVYGTDVPFNWPVTVDLVLNASFLNNAEKEADPERQPGAAAADHVINGVGGHFSRTVTSPSARPLSTSNDLRPHFQ